MLRCCDIRPLRLLPMLFTIMVIHSVIAPAQSPVDLVDQNIGRRSGAAVHVGASAPFGITNAALFGNDGHLDNAGGVSLLNIQGTGCDHGALGHVIVSSGRTAQPIGNDRQPIGHVDIHPHLLRFLYSHASVFHEATATRRCVVHRLRPQQPGSVPFATIDLGSGYVPARAVRVDTWSDSLVTGTLDVGGFCTHQVYQPIFVAIRLSGVRGLAPWVGGVERSDAVIDKPTILQGRIVDTTATIAIGMSLLNTKNAIENLNAEIGQAPFDTVVERNRLAWDTMLRRFHVAGGTVDDQAVWYTALFRAMQHPSVGEDVNGFHKRFHEQQAVRDDTYERTVNHDIWGFHQTNMGFYGAYMPDVYHNVVRTFLAITQERGEGPQFDFLGNQLYIMGGDPFPLVVHDAWMRGFLSISDLEGVWPMLFDAAVRATPIRGHLHHSEAHGFIPSRTSDGKPVRESVSFAMEYGMADAALSRMATVLGRVDDSRLLDHRSRRFWHNYDTSLALFRERLLNGAWETPFDPDLQPKEYHVSPEVDILGFKEGSGREFLFYPQHVRQVLHDTAGSWQPYINHLDTALRHPHFSLWNQMQMHLPFQYLYAEGYEHEAQRTAHMVRTASYGRHPAGHPGNDDLGSTSLWFVHTAIGLYPTLAFEGSWLVTAPLFDTVVIDRVDADGTHRPLTIIGTGPANGVYVRRVVVDGEPVAPTHVSDIQVRQARTIEIERSVERVSYPRRWCRSTISFRSDNGTLTLVDDDSLRETPLDVRVTDHTPKGLTIDTVLMPGVRTLTLPPEMSAITWSVRDQHDPAHDNAWIAGSYQPHVGGRPNGPEATPLDAIVLRPMPASYEVYLGGYDWSLPLKATAYDALGSALFRDVPVYGALSLRTIAAGMITVVLSDTAGNRRIIPLVIVR